MRPLPAHAVELVLQYIAPLVDPLPPHLISIPLRQRHHFLRITPSSPGDYLCWPSPDNPQIIDLLDRLPPHADQPSYPTRYTSDPESTFAHVQIPSSGQGLRLIFHWDGTQTWKYHDLRLMPFPSPSFLTPQESLASSHPYTARSPPDLVVEVDQINSDDDSYWASYGAAADDLPLQSASDTVGEEAYWAQYASIQGSADSTIPSPIPLNRKLRSTVSNDVEPVLLQQNKTINDVPTDAIHSRLQPTPPSPRMLTHLLNTISPRKDTCSPVSDNPHSPQSPSTFSPEQTTADSELITPPLPHECPDVTVVSPVATRPDGVPAFKCQPRTLGTEDKALTESIKGLYYLWMSGKQGGPDEKDRSVFLQIVQEAVATTK